VRRTPGEELLLSRLRQIVDDFKKVYLATDSFIKMLLQSLQ
jgi:hypothetical protein